MIGTGFLGYLNIAQNGYKLKPTTIITTTTNTLRTNISFNNSVRKFSTNSYNHTKMKLNILDIRCIIEPNSRINDFLESKNLNPVFIYDKLDQDLIRRKIAVETKGLSGIYLILNKETLGFYVGSASTNRFNTKFSKHLLYCSGSKILKNSVKKYGLANFCFIILELFPEIVNQENNKQLLNLEDFYLKSLLPDYNILTEAGSSFGYKHTEISRIKMKSEYCEERRNLVIGMLLAKQPNSSIACATHRKKFSSETIEAMRHSVLNREKFQYSAEALLNSSFSIACATRSTKNSKPIIVKELNGIVYGEYNSITETAEALNCSAKTVYRALKSSSKLLKKR
jgi:group I intron endonuclease